MEPISDIEFRQFAPQAREEYIDTITSPQAWQSFQAVGITTELRLCEFLAQGYHETGGFKILREDTNWTAQQMCDLWPNRFKTKLDPRILACRGDARAKANLAYSARDDLGNLGGDDGWDYRGGNLFQTTGRDNFKRHGQRIGCDLESNPELINNTEIGLRCALAEWSDKNLNRFADRHYIRAIGNGINRGNPFSSKDPIGAAGRQAAFDRAWAIFGTEGAPPVLPGLALGAYGSEVEVLQRRLKDLGYGVGAIDSVFGPGLARAVAAFKHDAKQRGVTDLEEDEIVGPNTYKAINSAPAIEVSKERQEATAKDLAKSGSQTVVAGRQSMQGGGLISLLGILLGIKQSGGLDDAQQTVDVMPLLQQMPEMRSTLAASIDFLKWSLSNFLWLGLILGGVWLYRGGAKAIAARLKDHQLGFNLFR